jgi:flap endonuclease-1
MESSRGIFSLLSQADPQAARRLAARALNLSRRSHEDERAERLAQWHEAFKEIEGLAEDEQMTVRAHFENQAKPTSISKPTTVEDRVAIQEKIESTTSLDMAEIDASLDRITTMIDTVSDLQSEYLAKISSGVSRKNPQGLTDALKHVTELERLHEASGEPSQPRDIYRSPPEEEETSFLDEALEQVVPEEAFRESKRQKELTEEEGRIITSFLSRRDVDVGAPDGMEDIYTPDQTPPMTRLEDLIQATPEMKSVYQRALNMPTPSDHGACRDLVIKMGVPVLEARIPYEAEGLAAALANAGLVDFVGTEDSDVIAYEVSRREEGRRADGRHPYYEMLRARFSLLFSFPARI